MNKHDLIIPVVKMQDGTQVTSGALDIDNVIQSDRNVIFFGDFSSIIISFGLIFFDLFFFIIFSADIY